MNFETQLIKKLCIENTSIAIVDELKAILIWLINNDVIWNQV